MLVRRASSGPSPVLACALLVGGLGAWGSVAPAAVFAAEAAEPGWARLVVTVREGRPADTRRFELPVRLDGRRASLHAGGQVALPNSTFKTTLQEGVVPVTSYTYMNVGFQLSVRASENEDGSLALHGEVESSRVVPASSAGAQPTVPSTEQTFAVRVKRGRSATLVDQRGDDAGAFVVEVAALK